MLTKFFKRLVGLDKVEQHLAETQKRLEEAVDKTAEHEREAEKARQEEIQAKLTPKERANLKQEPYVSVLNTHVNKDNVRNGFFELDWNDHFVLKLKQEGYGFDGDKDEEIVDRWFRELCANVVVDGDFGGAVNTGVIDINQIRKKNL